MHRRLWVVMLGLVTWALITGGRSAGAAPTRLVDVVPDVDANVNLTAPPAASFDISWVDPTTHTYYLADRSNASVDLIDIRSATFTGRITGFRGVQPAGPGGGGRSGPNGILVIPAPINQLWAGDGDSTVKVVDLTKGTIVTSISTGGTNRADELAYDSADGIIVIANDAEPTPFFTFISVLTQTVLKQLPYPNTTNGIEQPAWSPTTGLFYVAIPQSRANPGGEIAVLDPRTQSLATTVGQGGVFPLPANCIPHGLALGPHPNAIVGCSTPAAANPTLPAGTPIISVILNITTGATTTITQVGGSDEVWYNPGDNRYYLAANTWTSTGLTGGPLNPVLGIVDAGSNTFVANEPSAIGAHSVAVDSTNQAAFVPLPNGAVGVFTRAAFTPGAPLGQPPAGSAGPAGPAGSAGPIGPQGSSGGCALSPGAAFDPILVGFLGVMGVHLSLRCLSRRRGKGLSKPGVRS